MNKLKQVCAAGALTLALSLTTFAGNMDTTPFAPPTPPRDPAVAEVSAPDVAACGAPCSEATAIDPATELALYLFDSMMYSIF